MRPSIPLAAELISSGVAGAREPFEQASRPQSQSSLASRARTPLATCYMCCQCAFVQDYKSIPHLDESSGFPSSLTSVRPSQSLDPAFIVCTPHCNASTFRIPVTIRADFLCGLFRLSVLSAGESPSAQHNPATPILRGPFILRPLCCEVCRLRT
jgi:hypothetical protein